MQYLDFLDFVHFMRGGAYMPLLDCCHKYPQQEEDGNQIQEIREIM